MKICGRISTASLEPTEGFAIIETIKKRSLQFPAKRWTSWKAWEMLHLKEFAAMSDKRLIFPYFYIEY